MLLNVHKNVLLLSYILDFLTVNLLTTFVRFSFVTYSFVFWLETYLRGF